MSRYAQVEDQSGIVVNVIEWDAGSGWEPPAGYTMIETNEASPGWRYDGSTFTPPPTPDTQPAAENAP